MRAMKWLALVVVALGLSAGLLACNAASALNLLTPSGSFDRTKSVAYGALPRQTLDVYRSERAQAGSPALVFVHGGGWEDGDRKMYKFVGESFARAGYDVVVPNYRLAPEARYPSVVEDTARAAAWARREFDRPVILMGHSAGGYNVLQAVFAPEISAASGLDVCSDVAGVVALAAPTGVYALKEEPYISVFPDRFLGDDAPLNRAKAGFTDVPPVLFVHGADDTTVGPKNSTELAALLGERARVKVYPGRNHTDVVRLLAKLFEDDASIRADILAFMGALPDTGAEGFCAARLI